MSSLSIRSNRALNEKNASEVNALLQNNAAKTFYQSYAEFSGSYAARKETALKFNVPINVVTAASYYW